MTTLEMRAPRRAKQMLNSLLASKTITPDGLNWLTQATDPFHDTEIPPTGFPDADTSRSIVQNYTFTTQLTAPTPGALWDAHITFVPTSAIWGWTLPNDQYTRYVVNSGGTFSTLNNNIFLTGGYNAFGVPAGYDWVNGGLTTPLLATGLGYPRSGSSGQFRLVACGFEVVNTTPDLYRGGSVTVYRTPTSNTRRSYDTGVFQTIIPTTVLPPSTQAEAQLYPASRTWGAEDGAYVVGTLNSSSNPFLAAQPNTASLVQQLSAAELVANTNVYAFLPGTVKTAACAQPCVTVLPYDNHGAIFTGLQPEATLQVTVRYYIERIPTSKQSDLLVLTRPPTPYDPVALEIYSRCMSMLPVGVRVADNPLGEWFNDIMDTLANWAPKIGNTLGTLIPGASTIGNAVGVASRMASVMNKSGQPQAQPKAVQAAPKKRKKKGQTAARVQNQNRAKK